MLCKCIAHVSHASHHVGTFNVFQIASKRATRVPDTSEPEDSNGEAKGKAHPSQGKSQDSDDDDERAGSDDDERAGSDDDDGFGGQDIAHIRKALVAEVCRQLSVNTI